MKYFLTISVFILSFATNSVSQPVPASMRNSNPSQVLELPKAEEKMEEKKSGEEITTQENIQPQENLEVKEEEKKDVIIADTKDFEWDTKPEPQKNDNNLMRISFSKNNVKLSNDDVLALSSMLRLAEQNKTNHMKIKSFASVEDSPQKTRQKAILRVLELKEELQKNNFNFDKMADVFIYPSVTKVGGDYIDIDKD
ncbi:MAG: hypothetical protein SFT90_01630 [Rickettsiales bacterium]|nr:hypothetical protein [Rickettsiales bacterium]